MVGEVGRLLPTVEVGRWAIYYSQGSSGSKKAFQERKRKKHRPKVSGEGLGWMVGGGAVSLYESQRIFPANFSSAEPTSRVGA